MAKGKSQRALFEILAKERAQAQQEGEAKPGPIVRRLGGEEGRGRPPTGPARPAGAVGGTSSAPIRVSLTAYWIVVAAAAVVCLCVLFYLWGTQSSREPAPPKVEPRPTMEEIGLGPPQGGLVAPTPPAPTPSPREPVGEPGAMPAPAPWPSGAAGVGESAGPAEQGRFRLRIARLEVARSEYTDQLRMLLASRGIETDLAARGGYFILYSRERFAKTDDEKAKAFEKKVAEALKEFEQKTGWPATTNPYFVTVP